MSDAVHGGQQLRLFNAHYDGDHGFQADVVFDGFRLASSPPSASRQTARRQGDQGLAAPPGARHRVSAWPKTEILLRGDSHYCTPETIDFCRANGLDFIFGVRRDLDVASTYPGPRGQSDGDVRGRAENGKVRRFKVFFDGAQSWSRVERIVARVEAGRRTRYTLCRHQSDHSQRAQAL